MQPKAHGLPASLTLILMLTASCSDGPAADSSVPAFPCNVAGADAYAVAASIEFGALHRDADRSNGHVTGLYPHRIAHWKYSDSSGHSYDVYGGEIVHGLEAQTTCRYSSQPSNAGIF